MIATLTEEMGKPLGEGRAEVEKCAANRDHYADHAEAMLGDAPVAAMDGTFVAWQPLGSSASAPRSERAMPAAALPSPGAVFVSAVVAADPRAPFGGIKHTGHGRELGKLGIREFCNAKTIRIG